MNSMQRVLTTLSHREPDRVPYFNLLASYGAKDLGISVRDYFSNAKNVIAGQLSMQKKYGHDCFYAFFYAAIEAEAFGADVVFYESAPPNCGAPPIRNSEQVLKLEPPLIKDRAPLLKVLQTIEGLREMAKGEIPIIGVVISPYSLPVMQLGFARYLDILYFQPEVLARLLKINEEFTVAWANAQIEAGADFICYFDPLASPTMVEREKYLKVGYPVAVRTLSRIKGPTAIHLASGITTPVLNDLAATGAQVLGFSALDDAGQLKARAKGKITLMGNLNGLEMVHWSEREVRQEVEELLKAAAPGGGFILSDNHGEMPPQVPEEVVRALSYTIRESGLYPLKV